VVLQDVGETRDVLYAGLEREDAVVGLLEPMRTVAVT
jgi:hypothetical protein